MLEPASRFEKHNVKDTVVVFGSARTIPKKKALNRVKSIESKICSRSSAKLRRSYEEARRDLTMARYYEDALKLSKKLTVYFKELKKHGRNFLICSGGGPGIMGAASHGADLAGGKSIGLNISLPEEQFPNPHQTKELSFEFHYFFIRKFWFFYLAKALVVFPGGFGTMDELFELLTLIQTRKAKKKMSVILYGSEYWEKVINFDEMIKWGTISKEDLKLFKVCDNVNDAFNYLKKNLSKFSPRKSR